MDRSSAPYLMGLCGMRKKGIILQAIAIVGLIAWFVGMYAYVEGYNSKEFSYTMGTKSEDYDASLKIIKHWSELARGYMYGMQYDAKFENHTEFTLYDWEAKIMLKEGGRIDSYWNGELTLAENEMIFIPDTDITTILPNTNRTFGFILHSKTLDNVESFVITYHMQIGLQDLTAYGIWKLAVGLFAFIELINLITSLRTWRVKKKQKEFESIVNQSFQMFARLIDAKDPYTLGHSSRVALYSKELAKRMGIRDEECDRLYYIALLHDIGKIGIADNILNKKGKLTPEERQEIEKHVGIGGDILKSINVLDGIEEGARYHHERYDGKGYMSGLKGEKIPLFARIIAVADSFDAMSSDRCYRAKLEMPVIIEELKKGSGTQFDPKIAKHMLDMIDEGVVPIGNSYDM